MLFNSVEFLIFFGCFIGLYWMVRRHIQLRNALIVVASYYFYGSWDYRFLGLLVLSSLVDYSVGIALGRTESKPRRKLLLTLSLFANLVILGFFKYYGFFVDSLAALLESLGLSANLHALRVTLPVGLSFYTFQSMSYGIDVYRKEIPPTRNLINFLAFVSFFPLLVAGPIERASHLLPQVSKTLTITWAMLQQGMWLTLWGMFKKVVIADTLAPLVEMVYSGDHQPALMVLFGTIAFAVQIYCDFSGYSDIARGIAKFLGFDIMVNFNIPYAAKNLREFWQRWHISFSTWLRDYLYIPLGGNRRGEARTCLNLMITMLLGGLWHGARTNFVMWGLWQGAGLTAYHLYRKRALPLPSTLAWMITSAFVLYGWLLFRAGSADQVYALTSALTDWSLPVTWRAYATSLGLLIAPLLLVEVWQYRAGELLVPLRLSQWPRATLYAFLIFGIEMFWEREGSPFIYFQF